MAKLSIIVLQYNQSARTLACLESLGKQAYSDFDVIVVDNASETEHLKNVEYWIASGKNSIFHLVANSANLGYSGGNNVGIRYALEHGAEKILILNNDTVAEPDFLVRILEVDSDIVGVEELRIKGSFYNHYYLPGFALLIKKSVFEKIGYFDERYFLYYEDVEFCERARKAGLYLSIAKNAPLQHAVSASTKSLGSADLLYYHTRNILLLTKTHGSWLADYQIFVMLWKLWTTLKQRLKIALGRDVEISQAILQGIRDFDNNKFGKRESK